MKKAILIRVDRLGDLVLTLPMDTLQAFKDFEVHWAIPMGLCFLPIASQPSRRYFQLERPWSLRQFRVFVKYLRSQSFELGVIFHAPWWVSLALWWARVPLRVGVRSQWHSFLFLNRTIRQRRSLADRHESDFNRELVLETLGGPRNQEVAPLKVRALQNSQVLKAFNLVVGEYIVVHPGMGGSARNWSCENYAHLIRKLSLEMDVVVTGNAGDRPWIDPIKDLLKEELKVKWLDEKLGDWDWLVVLGSARAILAPSTGTIHLAAALGTPVVGIYSPVKVQHPRRWGPRGEKTKVFLPEVDCPGQSSCLGASCPYFDCMTKISVDQIDAELRRNSKGVSFGTRHP